MMEKLERALSALNSFDPSCPREQWVRIIIAAKAAGLSFEDIHAWSAKGKNYKNEKDCKNVWDSVDASGEITAATFFYMALQNGWIDHNSQTKKNNFQNKKIENTCVAKTNIDALKIWEKCLPAPVEHEYILRKQGISDGLRYYPFSEEPLIIDGKDVRGYLAVPCWSDDELQSIQFIPPTKGDKKLNLPRASFNYGYFILGVITNLIYIVEGIGQAWAVHQVSGSAVVVCFGAGRMEKIVKILRETHPDARLILMPDCGKEKQAGDISISVDCQLIKLPEEKPSNYDVNDYFLEYGKNSLSDLLANPVFQMPLTVTFADMLPVDFTPPDEIVEGVLIAGDGSILYGDTNCGKTFFVIDLACAIALGIDWFGRKTERGLVIYLAVESPASVKRRLQAYQKHYGVRIPNFAIVQNPIDLFDGESDSDAIIQTVHLLERQFGQKAQLIVGDTLARLSAGANENAGQDMGIVVRHFDRIRSECNAHFMLIHHKGKNAAAGARGWSGVRAAVDTEIEITDSPLGRCAEITKQRDLSSKGTRIGFKLETVTLGLTKWKSSATSCVVVPADAPKKQVSKRPSEIGGAIVEYLRTLSNAAKKSDIRKHFDGQYTSGGVYRQINALKDAGIVNEIAGYVSLVRNGAN